MERIDIAKLLKYCPRGMELESPLFNGLEFDHIDEHERVYPIVCRILNQLGGYDIYAFTKYGCYNSQVYSKCTIFPKGKTTWEGFVPPCKFKAGDVLVSEAGNIVLFSHVDSENRVYYHCIIPTYSSSFRIEENTKVGVGRYYECVLANEQQRQRMYDRIKCSGYKYNQSTNKLEKLIIPKFKIGDVIKWKGHDAIGRIEDIQDSVYHVDFGYDDGVVYVGFRIQDDYELVSNKFDISSLIPFESRVLFRNTGEDIWKPAIFGCYLKDKSAPYYALGGTCWRYCIPFDANEHLLGTTDDCDEYYKNWK